MGELFGSMMRMPDITDTAARSNIAVVSKDYLNLSIKFGYHYSVLDCFAGETPQQNHIYFRFSGGATDMAKRSRRVELIASVLRDFGFAVRIKGDCWSRAWTAPDSSAQAHFSISSAGSLPTPASSTPYSRATRRPRRTRSSFWKTIMSSEHRRGRS